MLPRLIFKINRNSKTSFSYRWLRCRALSRPSRFEAIAGTIIGITIVKEFSQAFSAFPHYQRVIRLGLTESSFIVGSHAAFQLKISNLLRRCDNRATSFFHAQLFSGPPKARRHHNRGARFIRQHSPQVAFPNSSARGRSGPFLDESFLQIQCRLVSHSRR